MEDMRAGWEGLGADEMSGTADPQAVRHYQDLLDRINRHFWARDWTALVDCISVPNRISAPDTERNIATHEEWLEIARAARQTFVDLGATEYHRVCRAARFGGDGSAISGLHETYILRGSTLAMPPYRGYMQMVRDGDSWRSRALHTETRDTILPTIHADRVHRSQD